MSSFVSTEDLLPDFDSEEKFLVLHYTDFEQSDPAVSIAEYAEKENSWLALFPEIGWAVVTHWAHIPEPWTLGFYR